jgi:hypothetical protein
LLGEPGDDVGGDDDDVDDDSDYEFNANGDDGGVGGNRGNGTVTDVDGRVVRMTGDNDDDDFHIGDNNNNDDDDDGDGYNNGAYDEDSFDAEHAHVRVIVADAPGGDGDGLRASVFVDTNKKPYKRNFVNEPRQRARIPADDDDSEEDLHESDDDDFNFANADARIGSVGGDTGVRPSIAIGGGAKANFVGKPRRRATDDDDNGNGDGDAYADELNSDGDDDDDDDGGGGSGGGGSGRGGVYGEGEYDDQASTVDGYASDNGDVDGDGDDDDDGGGGGGGVDTLSALERLAARTRDCKPSVFGILQKLGFFYDDDVSNDNNNGGGNGGNNNNNNNSQKTGPTTFQRLQLQLVQRYGNLQLGQTYADVRQLLADDGVEPIEEDAAALDARIADCMAQTSAAFDAVKLGEAAVRAADDDAVDAVLVSTAGGRSGAARARSQRGQLRAMRHLLREKKSRDKMVARSFNLHDSVELISDGLLQQTRMIALQSAQAMST